jgi:hypothetical protein
MSTAEAGAAEEPAPADAPTKRKLKRVDPVFVIDAVVKRYRYLFAGGKIMDVESPYGANSTDRDLVLKEAHRRWGGKKEEWRIEGVTVIVEKTDGAP